MIDIYNSNNPEKVVTGCLISIIVALVILAGIIFILIPFGKIEELVENKTGKKIDLNKLISRVFFVVSPVVAFFIV